MNGRRPSYWMPAVLVLALLAGLGLFPARSVQAAAFIVDSLLDEPDAAAGDGLCLSTPSGVCSLRAAIQQANASAGNDTITFSVNGTITLAATAVGEDAAATGDLDITSNGSLSITGNGPANTAVDGAANDRVFQILTGATVTLSNLTIRNGSISTTGGGLLNAGALTLNGVVVTNNQVTSGGAGGGLANSGGTLDINTSTIGGSNTANLGAGIYVAAGTVTVARTLISGNTAGTVGGGAYVQGGGTLSLTNVTVNLNSVTGGDGGGLYNDGLVTLLNVTISQNTASGNGSGVYSNTFFGFQNTALANNSSGKDCGGNLFSQGFNAIQNPAGCTVTGAILSGSNPLGAFNGQLYVLNSGSPAIDAGTNSGCPAVDQAGTTRPLDGDGNGAAICDLGAYEAPAVPTQTPTATNTLPPGVTPSVTPTPSATPIAPTATPAPTGGGSSGPLPTPVGVQPVGSNGGTFNCGDWIVTIPAGVVPNGGGLHCGNFDPNVAPRAPLGFRLLQHVINVNVYDNNGSWITAFAKALTFCYPYGTADLSAAGGNAGAFAVQTAPIGGQWSRLETTLEASARQACAKVSHLTLVELSVQLDTATTATYVVQPGDTLFSLALRFGTTVAALQAANGLTSDRIYVGQVLKIPGRAGPTPVPTTIPSGMGTIHVVQPGENLFRISLRYRTTVAALQAANGLGSSIRIYVGQPLVIPPAAGATMPGSSPTAPAPTSTALPPGATTHVVQPGENLFRISLRYRTTVAALQAANGLGSRILIYVGQTLVIPTASASPTPPPSTTPRPSGTYLVQPGDTLFRIALRFETTVAALRAANGLAGNLIYAGQRLVIPAQ